MRDLAVGYFQAEPFVESCVPFEGHIKEVYFSWPGVLSCRPVTDYAGGERERFLSDLRWCREKGIALDVLFNCNCYGEEAIGVAMERRVMGVLEEMGREGLYPEIVTTTSPFVAWALRRGNAGVEIRASVNLRLHGTLGFEHGADLFDSFYVNRERQRDFSYLAECQNWAFRHGKKLGMQVNSGCLRDCPYQQFHDNLHGHSRGRQMMEGRTMGFELFFCQESYRNGRWEEFLRSTWIRPEDLSYYRRYVSVLKLATRTVRNPAQIVKAYATGHFAGNLLELMDPDASAAFGEWMIDNRRFPADWAMSGIGAACAQNCRHCGRCTEVLQQVLV